MSKEQVNHPQHYGGKENPYEVVKVAEAWGLDKDAYLFNVLKYIRRSGKKDDNPPVQDLKKALWYLNRRIEVLEKQNIDNTKNLLLG
jgi:hypothetical protein